MLDVDSSDGRCNVCEGYSPCMTFSRGAGFWITNRGRRALKVEMLRLQGINPRTFNACVPDSVVGAQIGNAMSVNIVERVLCRMLPTVGLVPHGAIKDPWIEQVDDTVPSGLKRLTDSVGHKVGKRLRVA